VKYSVKHSDVQCEVQCLKVRLPSAADNPMCACFSREPRSHVEMLTIDNYSIIITIL
jgi:hypothetical protein